MTSKILVTGGCGYIGSHVVKKLIKLGYEVIVLDDLSTGSLKFLSKKAKFIKGDFADQTILNQIMSNGQIDTIMHFAAYINVSESIENPEKYILNNYEKSSLLWSVAVKNKVPHIIFSSTAAVYGEVGEDLIDEITNAQPLNPYGLSKLQAEHSLAEMTRNSITSYLIFRYFNVAGADVDGEMGQNPHFAHHLIAKCFDVVSGKIPYIPIYGDDLGTKDGTCIRDYIHVEDIAQAHIVAMEYLTENGMSDVFNLGSGIGYTVKEIIEAVEAITGTHIPVQIEAKRPGESTMVVANTLKFRSATKWEPQYTDIADIIKNAWKWYSEYDNE